VCQTLYRDAQELPTGVAPGFSPIGGMLAAARSGRILCAMKTFTLLAVIALAVSFAAQSQAAEGKRTLYHVVSLKFKPEATPDQIKAVETAFAGLKDKVPGILSLNWGRNVSPENRNKEFTHCFVVTFGSEKDRDAYLPHPEHKALGKVLGPVLADVMVIDFWGQE
jgi:Stress responsive A/B Barrel Domain